jgi:hypothetical protein
MVEAAGINASMAQQIGHAGSGKPSFPEKIARRIDEAITRIQNFRHGKKFLLSG